MYRARPARFAENLHRAVADDLICVHIGRGAGAGLEDVYDEFRIQRAVHHLLRCLINCGGTNVVQQAEFHGSPLPPFA